MPEQTVQSLGLATRYALRVRALSNLSVASPYSEALDFTTNNGGGGGTGGGGGGTGGGGGGTGGGGGGTVSAVDSITFSANPLGVTESGYDFIRSSLTLISVTVLGDFPVTSGEYKVQILKNAVGRAGDIGLFPTGATNINLTLALGELEKTYLFSTPFVGNDDSSLADLMRLNIPVVGTGLTTITVKALFA